jgi:hypothetical protein
MVAVVFSDIQSSTSFDSIEKAVVMSTGINQAWMWEITDFEI